MRLYHECGGALVIRHSIQVLVESFFDFNEGNATFFKHRIMESDFLKQFDKITDTTVIYCARCHNEVNNLDNANFKCDDCENITPLSEKIHVGKTLVICPACLDKDTSYDQFTIFGDRNKRPAERVNIAEAEISNARRVLRLNPLPLSQNDQFSTENAWFVGDE